MHYWGNWPDTLFADVESAAYEIGQFCRRWGRIHVSQTKEKYGTARVYCSLGWHQVHNITHPGFVYSAYPQWLWSLDCILLSKLIARLNPIIIPIQTKIYRYAYKRTLQKYPHIREEILNGADWSEYLEGL